MKILKLKSILFSLMAIVLITAFLSSCEKDLVETKETETEINKSSKLLLPFGVNENEKLAINYLKNATELQINTWKKNAEISERLSSICKLNEIKATLAIGENISELDLEKILSGEEINKMNWENIEIKSRGCSTVYSYGHYRLKKCCSPPHGDCYYYWQRVC